MSKKMIKKIACLCGFFFVFMFNFGSAAAIVSSQELYDSAVALEKAGDYAGAVNKMTELLKKEPENDAYLAYASHVERLAGDFKNGLKHALAAVEINLNAYWYYVSVALNAYGDGNIEIAKEYGKEVTDMGAVKVGDDNYSAVTNMLKNIIDRKYKITWTLEPEKGVQRNGSYYIPRPTSNLPYQAAKYSVTGAAKVKKVTRLGNDIVYIQSKDGNPVKMTASVDTKAYSYKSQLENYEDSSKIPNDVKPFLNSSEGINPKSTVIKDIVADLKKPDKVETIKNILNWMKKNITYKIEDYKNVEEIIERGYGECGGFSAVFTALSRAAGIPARVVWGVIEDSTPDRQFAPEGHLKGHAWVEFYLNGIGWIPVEPQDIATLGMLPTTYIRMYHYDISGKRWTTRNFHASDNMVIMGGDVPAFKYR